MKIFYVVTGAGPYGGSVALINLIDELRQRGVEVVVAYSSQGYGAMVDWLNDRKIKNYEMHGALSLNYPFFSFASSPVKWLYALYRQLLFGNYLPYKKLCRILREEKPDIVHTNIGTCAYSFFAAKTCGIPHVWHLREYQKSIGFVFFPSQSFFRGLLNRSYSIAITEDLYNFYQRNDITCRVIYDGVMHKDDINYNEEKADYFLFVGRIDDTKGAKDVVEAFCELSKDNCHSQLWLAGDGNNHYLTMLKQMVSAHGLEDRVKFLGFRSDRYELMQKAKALIVASKSEGFGFITVEAMMNGCLVIGRNTGGTKIIMDKAAGCAIPFMTKDELVGAMQEVVSQPPSVYKDRILQAQRVAQQHFSVEKNGVEVYNFYREILNPRKLSTQ